MDGSGSDDTLGLWVGEALYHYKGCAISPLFLL